MPKIPVFRQWKNNEIFNARDYVYERDTVVNEVDDQDDRLLTLETEARQFIYVQPNQPSEADTNDFDLWFKILN